MTKPQPTREYKYMVGDLEVTAMLTEDQAKRKGATLVGEDAPQETTPDETAQDKARRTRSSKG